MWLEPRILIRTHISYMTIRRQLQPLSLPPSWFSSVSFPISPSHDGHEIIVELQGN